MSLNTSGREPSALSFTLHLRKILPVAIKVWSVATVFYIGVLLFGQSVDVPIGELTRDPAVLTHTPYYFGFLSNFGALIWAAAAAICFLGYIASRQRSHPIGNSSFLLVSGLLTTLLLMDDFFLLHEEVIPIYLGIPEKLFVASYGLIILLYLIIYRNTVLKSEYPLLGSSFFFLGFSMGLDLVPFSIPGRYIFEDGAKFLGIVTWLLYFGRMVLNEVRLNADSVDASAYEAKNTYKQVNINQVKNSPG